MLHRVAFTELPRDPHNVRVLHHTSGGVLIAAVAYRHTATAVATVDMSAPLSSSSPNAVAPHRGPLFFTVVEMAAPNERGLPLRVIHVRVPRPSTVVQSLALLRSADGAEVYVVVQAAEVHAHHRQANVRAAEPRSVSTYVYRRQVVRGEKADTTKESWNLMEEENGRAGDIEDVVSSAAGDRDDTSSTDDSSSGVRVRYQRLPRAVAGADGPLWTAATAFSAAETAIFATTDTNPTTAVVGCDGLALLTASATPRNDTNSPTTAPLADNQLQLWSLNGTRLALVATWRIPALAGFPISQILTVPGTQDVAVLRCHNSLVEVNLAAVRRACAHYPHVVTTDAFIGRVWRVSPQERLTCCDAKDAFLYAGTEKGSVVVWDTRQNAAQADMSLPQHSSTVKTVITGMYAPYATGFVTCDASGGVRNWRERSELAEEDEAAERGTASRNAITAAAVSNSQKNNTNANDEEEQREHGVLRDVAGLAGAAAVAAAAPFPYASRTPVEVPSGEESCVAMDGHDNFVGVVGECGRLDLYFVN
ncbi:hypothetical protein NQL31_007077 [Lotmaria passim]